MFHVLTIQNSSKPEQLVFKYRNLTFSCAPLVDIRCVKETFEGAFQEGDFLHHMARAFSMSPSTYILRLHTGLQTPRVSVE